MPKKQSFFALVTGMALGAAAAFLSKEENRKKVVAIAETGVKKAQKLKAEYHKNPTQFKKKVVSSGKKLAKTVVTKAKKAARSARAK